MTGTSEGFLKVEIHTSECGGRVVEWAGMSLSMMLSNTCWTGDGLQLNSQACVQAVLRKKPRRAKLRVNRRVAKLS